MPALTATKHSLALDLKHPDGVAVLHRLAQHSDVLLENFAPGTMERLGCGYPQLSERNPGLIYCALKGFLSGPYETRQALDEVVQFMGGLAYMTGPRGRPLRAGASVVDILGGTFGAVAILAALHERARSGRGQQVKSALFESTVWLMATHMAGQVASGRPVPPMPERWSAWGVYQPFATADGEQLFVGITSDNHWRRFCEAFGRPELLAEARFGKSNEDRVREKDRLIPLVAEIMAGYSKAELEAICERIQIPFAPVARPEDLFDDPHLNVSGRLAETDFQQRGARQTATGCRSRWRSPSDCAVSRRHPAPTGRRCSRHWVLTTPKFVGCATPG